MVPSLREIPLYVVNEHNEAFYCWYKAQSANGPHEPLDLIHVDAHDDMAAIDIVEPSLYYALGQPAAEDDHYLQIAKNQLTMATFIRPAVLCGFVRDIFLVYPHWRNLQGVKKKSTSICSVFGEGRLLKHGLKVTPAHAGIYPDYKEYSYWSGGLEVIPEKRSVILDIDLDYFACRDTVTNDFAMELEITERQYHQKQETLDYRQLRYVGFEFEFYEKAGSYFVRVGYEKVPEQAYLPSMEEIDQQIDLLIGTLIEHHLAPAVITVCRSCYSGHCPRDYVDVTEKLLIDRLMKVYPCLLIQ